MLVSTNDAIWLWTTRSEYFDKAGGILIGLKSRGILRRRYFFSGRTKASFQIVGKIEVKKVFLKLTNNLKNYEQNEFNKFDWDFVSPNSLNILKIAPRVSDSDTFLKESESER